MTAAFLQVGDGPCCDDGTCEEYGARYHARELRKAARGAATLTEAMRLLRWAERTEARADNYGRMLLIYAYRTGGY